jgi:hypothetical protein
MLRLPRSPHGLGGRRGVRALDEAMEATQLPVDARRSRAAGPRPTTTATEPVTTRAGQRRQLGVERGEGVCPREARRPPAA